MPAVENAQLLAVQLQPYAIGVAEVHAVQDPAVGPEVINAGLLELFLRGIELIRGYRDREVLYAADRLAERGVIVTREVEKTKQVVVADVEEEVTRTDIIAVLDKLDKGESEELLVEADRLLDVTANQREVVYPLHRGRRPLALRPQVTLA